MDRGEMDIWNIRVKDGVYDIDIESLLKEEPVIVAGEEGRYLLSLSSVFRDRKKERKLIKKFKEK
jgi:predicted  nucleic acid-binding Zn-ribbon protein